MNESTQLYIVDAKSGRMKHIYLENIVCNSLQTSLKKFLNKELAIERAKTFTAKCSFPNMKGSIIVIGEKETFYEVHLESLKVTKVTIERLLPEIPEEDKIYLDAINALKQRIVDFSSCSEQHPVFRVTNGCIQKCYSEKEDLSGLQQILSSYLSEKTAERLAVQLKAKSREKHIFRIIFGNASQGCYVFNGAKLEKSLISIDSIRELLLDDFRYVPDLLDEASKMVFYFLNCGVKLPPEIAGLNIHHFDEKEAAYVEQEIFGISLMWEQSSNKSEELTFSLSLNITGNLELRFKELDNLIEQLKKKAGRYEDGVVGIYPFGGKTAEFYLSNYCAEFRVPKRKTYG